jgi:hypothetical protein
MNFYTSFEQHKSEVLLRGYEDGVRIKKKIPLHPYFFTTSKVPTKYKTLEGRFVDKVEFANSYEASQFKKKWDGVEGFKFYGMENHLYPWVNDFYPGVIDYDASKIVVANVDLECKIGNSGFPHADQAANEITALTINVGDIYHVFACKPYKAKDDNVKYYKCADEHELIMKFLAVWERISPDVIDRLEHRHVRYSLYRQ